MPNIPKISVVIPAYNEEEYIARCLESINNQTFKDYEIIVVDNNCIDKTVEIAKSFGARVVKQPIQGMTPARQKGFSEAQADIIARTDADSIAPPDWLEQIYKAFQDNPDAVGVSGGLASPKGTTMNLAMWFVGVFYMRLAKILTGHECLLGSNMGVKKSAWEGLEVHEDDKQVHEDVDLSCHLAQKGKIINIPSIRTTYSLRRIKKSPLYTAYEYPVRYIRTILLHHPAFLHKNK
ncbi:glycosyltransferase family 2 protein [Patescibacteria group bacterium]